MLTPERFFRVLAAKIPKRCFLRNTFLLLSSDCIFPELDTPELEPPGSPEFMRRLLNPAAPRRLCPDEVPPFYLWAYDANWDPPSATQDPKKDDDEQDDDKQGDGVSGSGCTCLGHFAGDTDTTEADEDGYEGRVKVDIKYLFSWFYYARLEGYDLKQLWRKAQTLPHQTWKCSHDIFDHTKPQALI